MTKVTVAEFKRMMIKGTKWKTTHKFIGENPSELKDLGTRECGLHNTVDFGFITDKGISHCQWPKTNELTKQGDTYYITKENFVQLTYTQIKD